MRQSYINMLNLTLVLGRNTHWLLYFFFFTADTVSILSSCSSGLRAGLSNWRQRKCNLKSTVTPNIQVNKDTHRCTTGQVCVCVCACGCVRMCVCASGIRSAAAEARLQFMILSRRDRGRRSETEGDDRQEMKTRLVSSSSTTLNKLDASQTFSLNTQTGHRRPPYRAGDLHMATEASDSLGRLRTTCSSCPESETS